MSALIACDASQLREVYEQLMSARNASIRNADVILFRHGRALACKFSRVRQYDGWSWQCSINGFRPARPCGTKRRALTAAYLRLCKHDWAVSNIYLAEAFILASLSDEAKASLR